MAPTLGCTSHHMGVSSHSIIRTKIHEEVENDVERILLAILLGRPALSMYLCINVHHASRKETSEGNDQSWMLVARDVHNGERVVGFVAIAELSHLHGTCPSTETRRGFSSEISGQVVSRHCSGYRWFRRRDCDSRFDDFNTRAAGCQGKRIEIENISLSRGHSFKSDFEIRCNTCSGRRRSDLARVATTLCPTAL